MLKSNERNINEAAPQHAVSAQLDYPLRARYTLGAELDMSHMTGIYDPQSEDVAVVRAPLWLRKSSAIAPTKVFELNLAALDPGVRSASIAAVERACQLADLCAASAVIVRIGRDLDIAGERVGSLDRLRESLDTLQQGACNAAILIENAPLAWGYFGISSWRELTKSGVQLALNTGLASVDYADDLEQQLPDLLSIPGLARITWSDASPDCAQLEVGAGALADAIHLAIAASPLPKTLLLDTEVAQELRGASLATLLVRVRNFSARAGRPTPLNSALKARIGGEYAKAAPMREESAPRYEESALARR